MGNKFLDTQYYLYLQETRTCIEPGASAKVTRGTNTNKKLPKKSAPRRGWSTWPGTCATSSPTSTSGWVREHVMWMSQKQITANGFEC